MQLKSEVIKIIENRRIITSSGKSLTVMTLKDFDEMSSVCAVFHNSHQEEIDLHFIDDG